MNDALLSSKKMDYCTPQDFFAQLDAEFHFTLDAAATEKSAKCEKYYTPETDGLASPWNLAGGYCILQPTVWAADRGMGTESLRRGPQRNDGRSAHSGENGHPVFPRLHLREGRDQVPQRAASLHRRRRNDLPSGPVPVDGGYLPGH